MTYAEAERSTGRTITVTDELDTGGRCVYGAVGGGAPRVAFYGGNGVVQRIDVLGRGVVTASGVGIGDTEARVREVYPGAASRPHPYVEGGRTLVVRPAGSPHQLLFETDGEVVTALRTGTVDFVELPEGCA